MEETVNPFADNLKVALQELNLLPPWGALPPIPIEKIEEELKAALNLDTCLIEKKGARMASPKEAIDQLGTDSHLVSLSLVPVPGEIFLTLPAASLDDLYRIFATSGQEKLVDQEKAEGLFTYSLLRAMDLCNRHQIFQDLRLIFSENKTLPQGECLCLDLTLTFNSKKLLARLILSEETLKALQEKFASAETQLVTEDNKNFPLPLSLRVGSSEISEEELSECQEGDFLLLDRCTIDPQTHKGTALLTLGSTPLFDVRVKEGEAKLLQPATVQPEDSLVAELAKFALPLSAFSSLSAGDQLPIDMTPGAPLSLFYKGKRVATGELIQLGDLIGIKILNLSA